MTEKQIKKDYKKLRWFYDTVYYENVVADTTVSGHLLRLASKIKIHPGQRILDVGCGTGKWLLAAIKRGAYPVGIDLSQKAISICKKNLPRAGVCLGMAETLPFHDNKFHVVSCLGSLEHFLDMKSTLEEIVRVARDDAIFLLLVPNADFLTRQLGLYGGTDQSAVREQVRTLTQWHELFEAAGLKVIQRWRDLHVLSWSWIANGKWYHIPIRAAQAIALLFWPLRWQYQVYHLCKKHNIRKK